MQLLKACTYHFFAAGSKNPTKGLWVRLGISSVCLGMLAVLIYQITPEYIGSVFGGHTWMAYLLLINLTTAFIFMIGHTSYKSFMQRTVLLSYIPLSSKQVIAYKLYAFTPLGFLAASIVLPLGLRIIDSSDTIAILIGIGVIGAVGMPQALLRLAYSPYAQTYTILHIVGSVYILRLLAQGYTQKSVIVGVLCTFALMHLGICRLALRHAPHQTYGATGGARRPFDKLTLVTSVAARALRSSRFIAGTVLLAVLFIGLCIASMKTSGEVPFDAVVLLTAILLGTIAQEVRSLSRKAYPTEHVLYGLVYRWHVSGWITATITGLLYAVIVLLTSELFFAEQLSVGMIYILTFIMSAIAIGAVASALIVPDTEDILSQLASVVLYGVGVWGVYRIFSERVDAQPMHLIFIAAVICFASFAISYGVEKVRWIRTIKEGIWTDIFRRQTIAK